MNHSALRWRGPSTMAKYIFEVYRDKAKLWRWRLREIKGRKRIIADSGEGYDKRGNAKRAVSKLIRLMQGAYIDREEWKDG